MKNNAMTKKERVTYLVLLIVNSALAFGLYRTMLYFAAMAENALPSFVVMLVYFALLLGFGLAYLIYNRFFYKKGLTCENLPDTMTYAEKEAFLADGERRLKRSKWMLLIIIPMLFTFLVDALDLFVLDLFF